VSFEPQMYRNEFLHTLAANNDKITNTKSSGLFVMTVSNRVGGAIFPIYLAEQTSQALICEIVKRTPFILI
jgi:hypothetical protein